jgi:hypothetical protein
MKLKITLLPYLLFLSNSLIAQDNYFYQNNSKITLTPSLRQSHLYSLSVNEQAIQYYTTNRGHEVGVYNKIIVKFKKSEDLDPFLLLSPFDVSIEKQLSELLYLLTCPSASLAIDMANRLTEQDFIEYAQPDFIKEYITK